MISNWKSKLLTVRDKRVRPGLDSKALTGWNGMMIKGLADAYLAFGDDSYLKLAQTAFAFPGCHRASELICFPRGKSGSDNGQLDDLFLENGHAQGSFQHRSHCLVGVGVLASVYV